MTSEKNFSPLSLALLGLLSQSPASGYDLRKIFSQTPMGAFSSSPGAIYPALKRLVKEGWVWQKRDAETARNREIHGLTPVGKDRLREELAKPVTVNDIIWRRDRLLLRFAFMGGLLEEEKIRTFLEQFAQAAEAYQRQLEAYASGKGQAFPFCAQNALRHGILCAQTDAKWAREALNNMTEKEKEDANTKQNYGNGPDTHGNSGNTDPGGRNLFSN